MARARIRDDAVGLQELLGLLTKHGDTENSAIAGRDTVLDHGLWLRSDREEWKKLIAEAGGRPRLLYFPVDRSELLRRLEERNQREDGNALTVTPEALDDFYARFEPPHDEGEEVIEPGSF
ncbi:AAA family ATPase [Streptomyces mirabilis]|uniref:AAA family ATPase n=1 Tax=Streptomyces mirabilis TaxID=68239 RepID=UPI0036838AE8